MMPVIRAGSAVVVAAEVTDMLQSPPVLMSPDTGVKVTLHAPDGTTPVTAQAMSEASTGRYTYQYQTETTSPLGVWTVEFKAQDGSSIGLTPPAGGFTLIA